MFKKLGNNHFYDTELKKSELKKVKYYLNESEKSINKFISENKNLLNKKSNFDDELIMNDSLLSLLNQVDDLKNEFTTTKLNKNQVKNINSLLLSLRVGVDYFVDDYINVNETNIMNFYDSLFKNNQNIHVILNKNTIFK